MDLSSSAYKAQARLESLRCKREQGVLLEQMLEGARILTLAEPKEIAFDWPAACRLWRAEYCRMNEGLNRSDEADVAEFYAAFFGFNGPIKNSVRFGRTVREPNPFHSAFPPIGQPIWKSSPG